MMLHVPSSLPVGKVSRVDSETLMLLRQILLPLFEKASNWHGLDRALADKGYGLRFAKGHLVIVNDAGDALCTGRGLGMPLADLARRLGRPSLRVSHDGQSARLV